MILGFYAIINDNFVLNAGKDLQYVGILISALDISILLRTIWFYDDTHNERTIIKYLGV